MAEHTVLVQSSVLKAKSSLSLLNTAAPIAYSLWVAGAAIVFTEEWTLSPGVEVQLVLLSLR